eukprot:1163551-Pyramimonas_sp.AAC.1
MGPGEFRQASTRASTRAWTRAGTRGSVFGSASAALQGVSSGLQERFPVSQGFLRSPGYSTIHSEKAIFYSEHKQLELPIAGSLTGIPGRWGASTS